MSETGRSLDKRYLVLVAFNSVEGGNVAADGFAAHGLGSLTNVDGVDIQTFETAGDCSEHLLLVEFEGALLSEALVTLQNRVGRGATDGEAKIRLFGPFEKVCSLSGASRNEAVAAVLIVGRAANENSLEEFRCWYDTEHMARLMTVLGVIAGTRYEDDADRTKSLVIYYLTDPQLPMSGQWDAVSSSPWTDRIRSRYAKWLDFRAIGLGGS